MNGFENHYVHPRYQRSYKPRIVLANLSPYLALAAFWAFVIWKAVSAFG